MGGSTLVFIVVLVVIPLVLAIGMALPFIADRDTARAFSPSRQLDRTPPHPAGVVRSSRIPDDRAGVVAPVDALVSTPGDHTGAAGSPWAARPARVSAGAGAQP